MVNLKKIHKLSICKYQKYLKSFTEIIKSYYCCPQSTDLGMTDGHLIRKY